MDYGLSFDSALTFDEIVERLNAGGPWVWRERDSAWYGNLASARAESLRLDLVESGPNELPGGRVDSGNGQRYALSVRARHEHPPTAAEWETLSERLRTDLLPRCGAIDVRPTDPID
jgi:hypothetical protein